MGDDFPAGFLANDEALAAFLARFEDAPGRCPRFATFITWLSRHATSSMTRRRWTH